MSAARYEFDLKEFCQALRDGSTIPADRFRQPDFQDIRCVNHLAIGGGAVAATIKSNSVQSFFPRFILRDYIYFAFAKTSREGRVGPAAWRDISGHTVNISAHTSSFMEIMRPAGHSTATVSLFVDRNYLVDCYKLQVDSLPEHSQAVFRGRPNAHFMFSIMLPAKSRMALDAIFNCKMAEPLKSIYWKAKYQELLTETVDALNRQERVSPGNLVPKSTHERELIETAAQIYRRDLGNAPSIAELALKLGINRNKLVDGFKEVYGTGPGDYAKGIRLDWAKEQLVSGAMTIGEAAHATGYSNPSAFARAYGEHFGKPPSGDYGFDQTEGAV